MKHETRTVDKLRGEILQSKIEISKEMENIFDREWDACLYF